ncbi:MAG: lytic transglycosylase [Candidatus Dactylopiibacterium carminicum]|uniref:Lytic transglycosylase n=1 Tax=Candidatus Dactylopiibacterium carminicum TaxID=857335 RepID=A0A272ER06_9RHOO|nr:transglycosylase SLT domain-containing protein [Candidatus Dactylopiibacterium carminicum]KAF7598657.1 lytic transglycosylase [Candidatus Dactylopiibacterium carminicum]PAS92547.1 MAG: lytic transglycosylase [Candidatus Dactylopiibacterium carminicum]PAS98525.1 MAG: lytic transglycosylase [Candidatus Dactylopiibacterium carminicum]
MKSLASLVCACFLLGCSALPTEPQQTEAPAPLPTSQPSYSAPAVQPSANERLAISKQLDSLANASSVQKDKPTAFQPGIRTVDLTAAQSDLWLRMRKGFAMPDLLSPTVDRQVQLLLANRQGLLTMLERGRPYLHHILDELEKRGMPSELALLPVVESAFNPHALSSASAAGLWQFIPSTGKVFQLRQNWWVDERRDVLASTTAALQYLQTTYEMHGDWHLALASYNWGENAVARAIKANQSAGRPTDFNSLRMPAETSQYVPKLQAIKQIVSFPEQYAIKLPEIPNQPYFMKVERSQAMDVALAAKLAEISLADFRLLNPAYNRPVIPGDHNADLLLPIENAQKFQLNLAIYNGPLLSWKTYTLPRRERVEDVARRLNLSAETLRTANGLKAGARLAVGYTLLIPGNVNTEARTAATGKPTPKTGRPISGKTDTAQPRVADSTRQPRG